MTKDKILAMKPGREFDALVGEHVFGWRKVPGPTTDYDGPCESFDVLVPPDIDDPFPLYPPRGVIKPWWFCHKWSTNISLVWEVVEETKMPFLICRSYENEFGVGEVGWTITWCKKAGCNLSDRCVHGNDFWALSAPEAICKAALLAKLEDEA